MDGWQTWQSLTSHPFWESNQHTQQLTFDTCLTFDVLVRLLRGIVYKLCGESKVKLNQSSESESHVRKFARIATDTVGRLAQTDQ